MSVENTEETRTEDDAPVQPGRPASYWKPMDRTAQAGDDLGRLGSYRELSRVMVLAFLRDKGAIFFLLIFPLLFLLLFGTLFRADGPAHAAVAQVGSIPVLDNETPAQKARVAESLSITRIADEAEALQKVKDGDLDGLIKQGPGNTIVLRYSSSDQGQAVALRSIATAMIQEANVEATGRPPTYTLDAAQVENVSLKPIQYLTPGLLGWAIATGAVFSSSLTLVTMRRRQILRRMRLSPVSPGAVVFSRIVVTSMIALVQTALFLAAATLPFFGLQLTGQWWLIVPLVLCATLGFMALGMFVGAVATSEETANGLAQLIVLPMSFLSGSFFSLQNAPDWLQLVAKFMPLRYLVTGSESVLTRGGGFVDVLPTMAGMLGFALVVSVITWWFFSWDD